MLQKSLSSSSEFDKKNFNEKIDDILKTPKTSETQEITADDFVLIQFSTKTTNVLYAGKVEERRLSRIR